MEERWDRDLAWVAVIAVVSCLLLGWVSHAVGFIAVANGQGWDGSVFVRVIREIAGNEYSNSDPYRTVRTVAFPMIYAIEFFDINADIVLAQRDVNITLLVLSTCMLYVTMRLKDVARATALVTAATFLGTWCVLVVPVFTPILTDHLAIFVSSLSLLLWAADQKRLLYILVMASVWIMPSAVLVPLALLVIRKQAISTRVMGLDPRLNWAFLLVAVTFCIVIYIWKGDALFKGIATHSLDFRHNPPGQVTGSVSLLPVSLLVAIVMLTLCVRTGAQFLFSHAKDVDARRVVAGLAIALASFALMRMLIDFDKGFTAGKLVNNLIKQSLSAPLKTWTAHTAYLGPAVLVTYYFVAFRQVFVPPALMLCLICFMPLLAFGSESRQWVAVLPVVVLALSFLPLTWLSRITLCVMTMFLNWGVWDLNIQVTEAVNTHVGLQHPLWNNYLGRVGPWMSMEVYRHWLALAVVMMVALVAVSRWPRRRANLPGRSK